MAFYCGTVKIEQLEDKNYHLDYGRMWANHLVTVPRDLTSSFQFHHFFLYGHPYRLLFFITSYDRVPFFGKTCYFDLSPMTTMGSEVGIE